MEETRKRFHQGLDEVHVDVAALGRRVAAIIPEATRVLLQGDLAAGAALVEGDDELDALAISIEERCCDLLVLQAPVARDLRSLVAALRLASEFERTADLVTNLVKGGRRLYGVELGDRLRGYIARMGEEAERLVRLAVDAYEAHSAGLAAAIDDIDDTLDQLQSDYIEAIFDVHAKGGVAAQHAMQLAFIGRYYERIGDHAVNIGERVHYVVTGQLADSHRGASPLLP